MSSPSPSLYLHDIPYDSARSAWHAQLDARAVLNILPSEVVPLHHALGRITAQPVWAKMSSPHYHASAMDGFAVRSSDTIGATESRPKQLHIGTQAIYVDTGDALPDGMNAVIMIEHVQMLSVVDETLASNTAPKLIEINQAVAPWQYVRPMGEDVVASELVLPSFHRIRPQDLGALAGCGYDSVTVVRRPKVAIIPTGTELVPPSADVKPGDIIEYNSLVLGALAEQTGAMVTRYPIHNDDYSAIKNTTIAALNTHDLVIINAGSSAGKEDFTARIIGELGEVCVHGVAIRPGHPVVLGCGKRQDQTHVALVGLPGYPVSAVITFDLFCKPILEQWQGQLAKAQPTLQAVLTRKVVSPLGDDEFMRVSLGRVGDRILATPISSGAGVISSLVKADGILKIPRFKEGFHAGETVEVELMSDLADINRTILAIGSHDMTLDVLANAMGENRSIHREGNFARLVSAHVGSLSGLLALQRGEAHLAGSHLLDENTGVYNVGEIKKLISPKGIKVVLLGFVRRVQGLMVQSGNPKALFTLADLARKDISFVNRQRGAGTRVLLDFELKKHGISPRHIKGYDRQEYTHLNVAAAVKSGACDCGLGILAAARALSLGFIPLFNERYDLVMPLQYYESDLLAPLLTIIRSSAFAEKVQALGGYDTTQMGEVIEIL